MSPEPAQALRAVVLRLADEGHARAEIYSDLEHCLLQVRARGDASESDTDANLDVLDALAGWYHPSARLLPDPKS